MKTGAKRELPVEALFVAIGHQPNTELFRGQLELDDVGYIKVEPGTHAHLASRASSPAATRWIPTYRQAVTAAGTGCMAAIDAERWLAAHGHRVGEAPWRSPRSGSSS